MNLGEKYPKLLERLFFVIAFSLIVVSSEGNTTNSYLQYPAEYAIELLDAQPIFKKWYSGEKDLQVNIASLTSSPFPATIFRYILQVHLNECTTLVKYQSLTYSTVKIKFINQLVKLNRKLSPDFLPIIL